MCKELDFPRRFSAFLAMQSPCRPPRANLHDFLYQNPAPMTILQTCIFSELKLANTYLDPMLPATSSVGKSLPVGTLKAGSVKEAAEALRKHNPEYAELDKQAQDLHSRSLHPHVHLGMNKCTLFSG